MASLVDSLLMSGKENKSTLESMEKTLGQMLAQDKKQAKDDKISAAKTLQNSKRLAADKKTEKNGDAEIISLLSDIKELLGEKDEDGKGGGMNPLATAASAAATVGGAILDGVRNIFRPKAAGGGGAAKGSTKAPPTKAGAKPNKPATKAGTKTTKSTKSGAKPNKPATKAGTKTNKPTKAGTKSTKPASTAVKGSKAGSKAGGLFNKGKSILKGGLTGLASAGIGVGAEMLIEKGGEALGNVISQKKFDEYFAADEKERAKLMERWKKRREKEKKYIESPALWLDKTINFGGETTSEETYRRLDGLIKQIEKTEKGISKSKETTEVPFMAPESFQSIQKKQKGGPITVPGSGSGDKVPMMLPPGSFVLNRNASKFLKRQTGGAVPTMLEPGELVYLNESIPRFNKNNVSDNQRNLSTTDALNAAKLQKGGLVLAAGHTDVPPGQAQGTDGPGTALQGKYKPTAEQHFAKLVASKAAEMSDSITYRPATGKYGSGSDSGANWQHLNSVRAQGGSAMELHFDAYGMQDGKMMVGKRGLLSGGNAPLTDIEKNVQNTFGTHPASGSKSWGTLILELDTIDKAQGNVDKLAKMLANSVGGKTSEGNLTDGGGGKSDSDIPKSGGGTGVDAVLKAAKANTGLSKGEGEQCANTTRKVLAAAGHPDAAKVTKTGDLDPEGTKYSGPGFAASFAGSDMGSVKKSYDATKAGDIILWKDTYKKYSDQPAGAITHVGIKGEGNSVYHHGKSRGWGKTGLVYPDKFAAGITLSGTDGATGDGTDGSGSLPGGVLGGLTSILGAGTVALMGMAGIPLPDIKSVVAANKHLAGLNLDAIVGSMNTGGSSTDDATGSNSAGGDISKEQSNGATVDPQTVYKYIRAKGISHNKAMGIVAGIDGESGFQIGVQEKGHSKQGVGLFQFPDSKAKLPTPSVWHSLPI